MKLKASTIGFVALLSTTSCQHPDGTVHTMKQVPVQEGSLRWIPEGSVFSVPGVTSYAHGCNCKGAMGKGIAKQFKERYSEMYQAYKLQCQKKKISTWRCVRLPPWQRIRFQPGYTSLLENKSHPGSGRNSAGKHAASCPRETCKRHRLAQNRRMFGWVAVGRSQNSTSKCIRASSWSHALGGRALQSVREHTAAQMVKNKVMNQDKDISPFALEAVCDNPYSNMDCSVRK